MGLFTEAEFWVGVAFLIFIAILLWAKVPALATKSLDARAEKIRAELAEAERLRKEAEGLLADIRARREATERQAAEMLANAEVEARRMEEEGRLRLEEQIKRRAELAERRIGQAEAQAAADVKSAAAELAAEAAASVLAARLQTTTSDPLVDKAVAELSSKLQ
ncbi:MAG: ATP F0F1 synthase subunit B [Caulobacteraceae bacterium]